MYLQRIVQMGTRLKSYIFKEGDRAARREKATEDVETHIWAENVHQTQVVYI